MGQVAEYQKAVDAGEKTAPCIHDDLRRLAKSKPEFRYNWGTMMSVTDLGAGVDTMSWTMIAFLVGVSTNPAIYIKIQAELDSALKAGNIQQGEPIPYEEAAALPYFQAAINEGMRLWPNIAISLPRIVPPQGLEIDNYFIPAGYAVGINPSQLGRSEEVFGPDTESFKPERWLEASKEQRNDMDNRNLAFGGSSRKCPGKNVAWVCMSKILPFLLLNFDVKVLNKLNGPPGPGGGRWVEKGSFPTKWEGMEAQLTAR